MTGFLLLYIWMQLSEKLDFSPVMEPNQPIARRSAAGGEFEFSDMNDFHRPAQDQGDPDAAAQLRMTDSHSDLYAYLKKGTDAANVLNVVANSISAVVNSSPSGKKHKWVNNFADFGAKLSMGVNSIFNIYNGHKQKETFNVIGYLSELAIALFAPYNIMGLLRGLAFSLYQVPNFVTSLGKMPQSKSYGENMRMINNRLGLALKKIFQADTYKNFSKNFGLLSGTWGGIFSGAGVLTWLLTGSTKVGGMIKGVGEILVDSFQISKEHWLCKRTNYINSGLSFIMGSLCEMISKQRNNEPVTMALYFVGSGIGRMFMTWSNANGERNYSA